MKKVVFFGIVLAAVLGTGADTLEQGFREVPMAERPWCYYWWVNGNVDTETITRDLEAMRRIGFGGILLFDARGYHEDVNHLIYPKPKMEFMSDTWRAMVTHTVREAARVGLTVSVNLSSCAGALKGPWEVGADAPKRLVYQLLPLRPGLTELLAKPAPLAHFKDVAAFKVHYTGDELSATEWRNAGDGPFDDWYGRRVGNAIDAVTHTAVQIQELTGPVTAAKEETLLNETLPNGVHAALLRFGYTVMDGHEYDVDILDAKAVEGHFNRMGKALLDDIGPLAGKTLTHFYNVSWEGETPSWTPGFEREFLKLRGYDMRPYLPALAGIVITGKETTARFLRDYALTVSDCFMENCYGRFDELCGEAGVRWHSESGGPWNHGSLLFREADQLAFCGRNAMPQGEFWVPGYRSSNVRRTAMGAHIYGKRLASVEAFTHMTYHWSQYPASLKSSADLAFCDGANQFVWHTSTASPEEFGLPGIVYFAGTHVNRNVTWFGYAGAFFDYLARCQALLRRGNFVADVCCYTSHKNCAVWSRGRKWSEKASLDLPPGYAYDLVNPEVLCERIRVGANGDLVLPDGMRYRMLVVDLEENVMPVETLRKVVELAEAGATVVLGERKPTQTPGLKNHAQATEELATLSAKLWRSGTEEAGTRTMGKGTVIAGKPLAEVLNDLGIVPDFEGTEDYIHRRDGETDIYFVAGQGGVNLTFRVAGKEPEIWDPTNGRIIPVARYLKTDDGRVTLPMTLPSSGSLFVVFRNVERQPHMTMANGPAQINIEGRNGIRVPIRFWKDGQYAFANSQGRQFQVDVAGLSQPLELDDSWEVAFAPGWEAPESAVFDRLVPWNTHEDPNIKYFSGTATYRKKIDLTTRQAEGTLRLHLGEVGCIARVRLNGDNLGVVWTAPWTIDLTGAAKSGENLLEIDVANVWQNRLIGDAGLPADQRRTNTNVILEEGKRTRRYRCSSVNTIDPLTPSGLMGPVRLEFGEERDVTID